MPGHAPDRSSQEREFELAFDGMIQAGARLIEAQRAEEKLDNLYRKSRTALHWKKLLAVRRQVDDLAQEYLASIRKYRELIE